MHRVQKSQIKIKTRFICLTSIDSVVSFQNLYLLQKFSVHSVKPSFQYLYQNSTRSLKEYLRASKYNFDDLKTSKRVKTFFQLSNGLILHQLILFHPFVFLSLLTSLSHFHCITFESFIFFIYYSSEKSLTLK